MSRSNPTADSQSNPATRFFEWSGSDGKVKYYDKEAQETVKVDLPFSFIVLDQLNTITGYNKKDNSGYWSNEIRDLNKDVLVVKTKAGVKAEGLYKNLAHVLAAGGKYTKSIYIAYKNDDGELVLGHIKLAGSAISAWIEFSKTHKVMDGAIVITDTIAKKNGKTDYFEPVFEMRALSEEADAKATELDKELQVYLNQYLSSKRTEERGETTYATSAAELDDDADEEDDEEETQPEPPKPQAKAAAAKGNEINIKDVPF